MITLEASRNGETVELLIDEAGLQELLSHLRDAKKSGDAHLRTPAWAGSELEEQPQSIGKDTQVVQSLTIRYFDSAF